jgi:hypothetical protein
VRLDLVAVAVAVFLLDGLAGCGRAGDDAVGAVFGMPRLAAASRNRARVACDARQRPGWLAGKLLVLILEKLSQFLEIYC